jgi:flavorubredoxin
MPFEPLQPIHMPPLEVAPDTFLIRSAQPAMGAPLSINLNSLVIRAEQPVIVDTGTEANRERWLHDVTSLVDPVDVRWVFLSHDDHDHTGNLAEILELCPNATLVTNWATTERIGCSIHVPANRMRWIDDGGSFDAGDRVLHAIRPPAYDSPTTRGLFDPATGVYWASDAFATPMTAEPVDRVDDLPPEMWAEGMAMFHYHGLSPWLAMVNRDAYAAEVQRLRDLDLKVITGAHTPLITGPILDTAMRHLASLPEVEPPPHPDQQMLDAMLAAGVV